MFSFITTKIAIYASIGILLLGSLTYIIYLKKEVKILEENQVKLELAVESQKRLLELKDVEIIQIKEYHTELVNTNNEQLQKIQQLQNKFHFKPSGKARDFGKISRAKPGLVNKLVNASTEKVNRCLELATGSKPFPGEKNDSCQELIDNYNTSQ